MSPEKKEFLTVTLPIILTILAATFTMVTLFLRFEDRWYDLLKEMHRIDKNIQKVEIENKDED